MSFLETIESARAFLERNGRVSIRALKREFELDDEALDELVEELVAVQQVAAREGKIPGGGFIRPRIQTDGPKINLLFDGWFRPDRLANGRSMVRFRPSAPTSNFSNFISDSV